MHMRDELLSPEVGLFFMGASIVSVVLASRKLKEEEEETRIPLIGVLAAFVFAAQMVNFPVPGTGSSGHLVGSVLLSVLLGPARALICLAAILIVQCLVFSDGGLLALGCNFFNMGLIGSLVGWWLYKVLSGKAPSSSRRAFSSGAAAWFSVVLGSVMVAVETILSGRVEFPFLEFLEVISGIHALIGIGEGLITSGVVLYLLKNKPILFVEEKKESRKLEIGLGIATILVASLLSLLASPLADGLESSLERIGWSEKKQARYTTKVHEVASRIQKTTSVLPDYEHSSISGIIGAGLTFIAAMGGMALIIGARRRNKSRPENLEPGEERNRGD